MYALHSDQCCRFSPFGPQTTKLRQCQVHTFFIHLFLHKVQNINVLSTLHVIKYISRISIVFRVRITSLMTTESVFELSQDLDFRDGRTDVHINKGWGG